MGKKRILSILTTLSMVIVMMFTVGMPAFAAIQKGTVTINNIGTNAKVDVYKIIDLNINEDGSFNDVLYSWDANVATWLKSNDTYKKYVTNDSSNAVTDEYTALETDDPIVDGEDGSRVPSNNSDITKFYQTVSKAIYSREINIGATKSVENVNNSVELTGLSQGQYLVLVSETGEKSATKIYYPMVFNVLQDGHGNIARQDLTMKQKPVTIEKEVEDPSVGIGDVKKYTITTDIPVYPTEADEIRYEIGDLLPRGLTLNSSSIKVYITNSDSGQQNLLIESNDYTLDKNANGDFTFKVIMKSSILKNNPGENILVKYDAKVNENAFNDATYLENKAFLGINTNPFDNNSYTKIPTTEQLYTYNIEFTKKDFENTNITLNNAQFKLYKGTSTTTALKFIKEKEGVYKLAENQENSGDTSTTDVLMSDANGKYLLKGLDTGTYTLKEIKAPDGYILPSGTAKITLVDKDPVDGKLDQGTDAQGLELEDKTFSNSAKFTFTVKNKKPGDFDLPITGGTGTLIFTIGGLAVMSVAVYLLVSKKRKQAK